MFFVLEEGEEYGDSIAWKITVKLAKIFIIQVNEIWQNQDFVLSGEALAVLCTILAILNTVRLRRTSCNPQLRFGTTLFLAIQTGTTDLI